ncbi:dihydroxy-acid dehydratase [Shigella flexneri]
MQAGCQTRKSVDPPSFTLKGKRIVKALLEAEAASYHAPGTCTFYGTANTNQMVVEFMGTQRQAHRSSADAPLRKALTRKPRPGR